MLKSVVFTVLSGSILFGSTHYSQAVLEKKIYPMGKKIFEKKCSQPFTLIVEGDRDLLKKQLQTSHICGTLSKKHLDILSLYIQHAMASHSKQTHYEKLTVSHQDKCPVCGMFLYKYPRWVSRLYYGEKSYSFDGVKDMLKYYFTQGNQPSEILVQDYYTTKTIPAKEAYFVLGSDIYGPMGNELIPFATQKSAHRFMMDHKGKKVVRFDAITPKMVEDLDNN